MTEMVSGVAAGTERRRVPQPWCRCVSWFHIGLRGYLLTAMVRATRLTDARLDWLPWREENAKSGEQERVDTAQGPSD